MYICRKKKMDVQCEDCKFAIWEANLFADAGVEMLCSEQWDVHCTLHNRFFLDSEISGNCTDGLSGENNLHEVAHDFYQLRKRYLDLLHKCAKEKNIEIHPNGFEKDAENDFSVWMNYLKEHDLELYNILKNE